MDQTKKMDALYGHQGATFMWGFPQKAEIRSFASFSPSDANGSLTITTSTTPSRL